MPCKVSSHAAGKSVEQIGKDFFYRLPSTFSPPLELSPLGAGPALCMARIPSQDSPDTVSCQPRRIPIIGAGRNNAPCSGSAPGWYRVSQSNVYLYASDMIWPNLSAMVIPPCRRGIKAPSSLIRPLPPCRGVPCGRPSPAARALPRPFGIGLC